ncbi:hypothetical protein FD754_023559, partial [Muntiacus muntjak]
WSIYKVGNMFLMLKEKILHLQNVNVLHEYLNELKRDLAREDQETLPKDQLDRKRFLKFPQVKQQLGELIGKLHELADKVDKVHRNCTIFNMVAHSAGAMSGILTLLGLTLAPVTAGASLALGLGAVATVTSVSTSIMEHKSRSSAETEVSRLMSTAIKKWKVLLEVLKSNRHIADTIEKLTEAVKCIEINIPVMETGKANTGSSANANVFMSSEGISIIQLAMAVATTKAARIISVATAGVFFLVDVSFLVKESMHLHDGAKAVSAENLRKRARELERKLEELTQICRRTCLSHPQSSAGIKNT